MQIYKNIFRYWVISTVLKETDAEKTFQQWDELKHNIY